MNSLCHSIDLTSYFYLFFSFLQHSCFYLLKAFNGLLWADVQLRNYSLTHSLICHS